MMPVPGTGGVMRLVAIMAALVLTACDGGETTGGTGNVPDGSLPRQETAPMRRPPTAPAPSRPIAQDTGQTRKQRYEQLEAALNPGHVPQDRRCQTVDLGDPVTAARERIRRNDLRPFMVMGFVARSDVPGVSCPDDATYEGMPPRGGSFVSDIPDVCGGGRSFHGVPIEAAAAYNRIIAGERRFQELTGCRGKDPCEDAEDRWSAEMGFNASCPASAQILSRLAARGTDAAFAEALAAYPKATPAQRDGLTEAMLSAIASAKWDRMKALVAAGASTKGRLSDGTLTANPVYQVFNQNGDKASKIPVARWLLSHGGDFTNAKGEILGIIDGVENVKFLLDAGAPPNGYEPADGRSASERPLMNVLKDLARHTETTKMKLDTLSPEVRQNVLGLAMREIEEKRAMAIMIFAAGGRPDDWNNTNWWRRRPGSITEASILLAYASEKGEFQRRITEMLPYGGKAAEGDDIMAYLKKASKCVRVEPRIVGTTVRLCPGV